MLNCTSSKMYVFMCVFSCFLFVLFFFFGWFVFCALCLHMCVFVCVCIHGPACQCKTKRQLTVYLTMKCLLMTSLLTVFIVMNAHIYAMLCYSVVAGV